MKKGLSMDINFTDYHGAIFEGNEPHTCEACHRLYMNHGVPVTFNGWRGEEYGKRYAMNGVFYFLGNLCADCLLSPPAELAAKIRTLAGEILREPNIRRKQRVEAERMIEFAGELEKVDSIRDLPGGIMAIKIAEAYREIEKPRSHRTHKAA
jgi:hypothetical protein